MSTSIASQQFLLFDFGLDLAAARVAQERFMQKQKALNTVKMYEERWRFFCDWCHRAGICPLPASEETIRLFVSWSLDIYGSRLATVKIALNAISDKHREIGISPVSRATREFLTNCARIIEEEPRGRAALSIDQMRSICTWFDSSGQVADIRDKCIFLLGFACGWRRSEIIALRIRDLTISADGVLLFQPRSKTDQLGRGRWVGVHRSADLSMCPVRALEAWLQFRGEGDGPLFYRMHSNRQSIIQKSIRPHQVNNIVKRSLFRIGIDPSAYGAHSLRAGFVTAAARAGRTHLEIMERTGQKTLETVQRYIRPAKAFASNPLEDVL